MCRTEHVRSMFAPRSAMDAALIEPERRAEARPKGGAKARLRTLDDLDRRTKAGQAALKLRDDMAADLGGWDRLSAMQRELVSNAALLGAMIEDAGVTYLKGEPVDLAEFMALTNAQRRLLADLGLDRRLTNVTPNAREYLARKERAA